MQLNLDQIRLDGGTQPRAEVLIAVVEEYAEQMRKGAVFPPVIVFHDGTDYWLADGFHRVEAAKRARPDQPIDVEVEQGTQSDAQWYSYSVNKVHGLRRTNPDKERAVKAALKHPRAAGMSSVDIARHCGVAESTVRNYRNQLTSQNAKSTAGGQRMRTGLDGRTINTANIGRNRGATSKIASPHRTTLKVHQPVRLPIPIEKMTAVTLPHNPVMGARTLIEVFDATYLRAVVNELVAYLDTVSESA